jgi:hypothetical protein
MRSTSMNGKLSWREPAVRLLHRLHIRILQIKYIGEESNRVAESIPKPVGGQPNPENARRIWIGPSGNRGFSVCGIILPRY